MLSGSSSSISEDFTPSVTISKEEITQAYLQYLIEQHQSYFHTVQGSNPGDSALAIIEADSQFEAEHVNGMLRYLIGQRPHFANQIGIFPVFNQDAFYRLAQDQLIKKMLNHPDYQYLVKDTTPLIELSDCLDFPELWEKRNTEEVHRTWQDQEAIRVAGDILDHQGTTDEVMLEWYLESIAASPLAFLGNMNQQDMAFKNCSQFIIPLRIDGVHYTVAIVDCTAEDTAHIKYYDSMGHDLQDYLKQQLINFFENHFADVTYECVSKHEQKDGYNCGIFASFKAIDLININTQRSERLLPNLNTQEYHALFNYFRNQVAEMLRLSGCNIELDHKLAKMIQTEHQQREEASKKAATPSLLESFFNGFYSTATSILGIHKPVQKKASTPLFDLLGDLPEHTTYHPKTSIAHRQWSAPSALFFDLKKKKDKQDSSEEYGWEQKSSDDKIDEGLSSSTQKKKTDDKKRARSNKAECPVIIIDNDSEEESSDSMPSRPVKKQCR
ncbi:hypothetical protein [Candidatus Berkiella aquae]|uniref:Ubiquitin-like protease family profile domain-containing protein n=1 Tax=Candidatus Berkiella aquae TaxID=295108 RepID=A0A0Q9YY82_9GAMM|nr:hypothetical protein [Candidatus Berkiella aquae]MCS5711204.1 hypothetical protein [Candidatus Berkiella aquae]